MVASKTTLKAVLLGLAVSLAQSTNNYDDHVQIYGNTEKKASPKPNPPIEASYKPALPKKDSSYVKPVAAKPSFPQNQYKPILYKEKQHKTENPYNSVDINYKNYIPEINYNYKLPEINYNYKDNIYPDKYKDNNKYDDDKDNYYSPNKDNDHKYNPYNQIDNNYNNDEEHHDHPRKYNEDDENNYNNNGKDNNYGYNSKVPNLKKGY